MTPANSRGIELQRRMRIQLPSFAVVSAALLIGCASAPPESPEAVASAMAFSPTAGRARLYVVRRGSIGTAVLFQVAINGRIVGSLPTRSFLSEELLPGRYNVSIFAPGNQETVILDAEAAKVYFVRAELSKTSLATKAVVTQVSEKEGRRLVTDLPMMQSAAESHP